MANPDQYSERETIERRENAIRRMLVTPHKPHKPRRKKAKKSRARSASTKE
jgi:hypothetical protein